VQATAFTVHSCGIAAVIWPVTVLETACKITSDPSEDAADSPDSLKHSLVVNLKEMPLQRREILRFEIFHKTRSQLWVC
jgi:hypothetical protein